LITQSPSLIISVVLGIVIVVVLFHLFLKHTKRIHIIRDVYYRFLFAFGIVFLFFGAHWMSPVIIVEGLLLMILALVEQNVKGQAILSEDKIVDQVNELIAREHQIKEKEKKLKKQIETVYQMAKIVDQHADKNKVK